MERLHSQANQPNSACPYTLNGRVTALPCPFHHNHLSSTPLKLSTALPADNIPLCQPLRPAIKRINSSISAWWILKKTTKWTTNRQLIFRACLKQLTMLWKSLRAISVGIHIWLFKMANCVLKQILSIHCKSAFPKHRNCTASKERRSHSFDKLIPWFIKRNPNPQSRLCKTASFKLHVMTRGQSPGMPLLGCTAARWQHTGVSAGLVHRGLRYQN